MGTGGPSDGRAVAGGGDADAHGDGGSGWLDLCVGFINNLCFPLRAFLHSRFLCLVGWPCDCRRTCRIAGTSLMNFRDSERDNQKILHSFLNGGDVFSFFASDKP